VGFVSIDNTDIGERNMEQQINGAGGHRKEDALGFAIKVQTASLIGSSVCPTIYEDFALELP
jgi:hypothetical protein